MIKKFPDDYLSPAELADLNRARYAKSDKYAEVTGLPSEGFDSHNIKVVCECCGAVRWYHPTTAATLKSSLCKRCVRKVANRKCVDKDDSNE